MNIVNVAAAASCHDSARLDRVSVEPILATVRAGWKKRMDSRLTMRQHSRLSKANGPEVHTMDREVYPDRELGH